MDWYLDEGGDIKVSPSGDLAMTDSSWRDDCQQAYIRIMTEPTDFTLYPTLGAELSLLYGMPQTEETGNLGASIIQAALDREGRFIGKPITIKPWPTGPQTIRFDVFIESGSRSSLLLSIDQSLGVVN